LGEANLALDRALAWLYNLQSIAVQATQSSLIKTATKTECMASQALPTTTQAPQAPQALSTAHVERKFSGKPAQMVPAVTVPAATAQQELCHRFDNFRAEMQHVVKQLEDTKIALDRLGADRSRLLSELATTKSKSSAEISVANKLISKLKTENAALKFENAALKNELTKVESAASQKSIAKSDAIVDNLSKESLSKENKRLSKTLEDTLRELRAKEQELSEMQDRLKSSVSIYDARIDTLNREAQEERRQREEAQRLLDQAIEQEKEQAAELERYRSEVNRTVKETAVKETSAKETAAIKQHVVAEKVIMSDEDSASTHERLASMLLDLSTTTVYPSSAETPAETPSAESSSPTRSTSTPTACSPALRVRRVGKRRIILEDELDEMPVMADQDPEDNGGAQAHAHHKAEIQAESKVESERSSPPRRGRGRPKKRQVTEQLAVKSAAIAKRLGCLYSKHLDCYIKEVPQVVYQHQVYVTNDVVYIQDASGESEESKEVPALILGTYQTVSEGVQTRPKDMVCVQELVQNAKGQLKLGKGSVDMWSTSLRGVCRKPLENETLRVIRGVASGAQQYVK
jgi:hypothetical protein